MTTTTVDTATLANVITQCFAKAMNQQYSLADQKGFLIEGKRLRGQLLNLLSAQFDQGSAQLTVTNASLAALNSTLSSDATVLADTAQVLSNVATLVGNLDDLLKIAVSFV